MCRLKLYLQSSTCMHVYVYSSTNIGAYDIILHYNYSEICELTSIRKEDVVSTLQTMNLVQYYRGQYIICLTEEVLERHARSMNKRKIRIDPKCIKWTPKDWSKRGKW